MIAMLLVTAPSVSFSVAASGLGLPLPPHVRVGHDLVLCATHAGRLSERLHCAC